MVQNAPPSLDFVDKMCFSYPVNIEYPNTIAFSGIQSGVLMAYSSGDLIIVLCHCRYVKAILSGHKGVIISITFEMRGPHIIACDVNGTYYFWHYNDTGYEKSRVVDFGIPATCISWFPARREISLSTKNGLLYGGIHNFGKTTLTKLNNRSTFCQFNSDGTLLASHHNNSVVTFYIFSSNPMITQVVRHFCPVVQFDFHPYLPIFLSITTDLVLHIWRLTKSSNFVCTSRIKVNGLCKFIKYPVYFLERMKTNQKPARIAFIDQEYKISSIEIDRNGQILNENKIRFDTSSISIQSHLLSAFKTNFGVSAAIIQENGILVSSKSGHKHQILYHTSNISHISFSEKGNFAFSLDVLGTLIIWPVFDTYYSCNLVSNNASHAVWFNDQSLLYLQFNHLTLYCIHTSETTNFPFPDFTDCVEILVDKKETVYVLTKTNIVLKDKQYKIPEFSHHSFSYEDDDHFTLVLLSKETSQFTIFMMPEFKELKCSPRNHKSNVKSIANISLDSFAVLNEETLEFWNSTKGEFAVNATIQLSGMQFIKCCSSLLFAWDKKSLYLIENGVYQVLKNVNISCITTNRSGSIAYAQNKSFTVLPSPFNTKKVDKIRKIPKDEHLAIRYPYNFKISPFDYVNPQEESFHVIHSTFIHLLEYESLIDYKPRQIPAVPNQLAFHLTFPKTIKKKFNGLLYNFDFEGKNYLKNINSEKKDEFDLYGLRYLYSIHESALPLSYFSLWLSFSLHQSEICEYLTTTIDANSLTKFYLPLCVHDHKLLVSVVKSSVQRTWSLFQKVENVALLLIALGQQLSVSKLYNTIGDTQRGDFFTHDFTTKRFRKSAIKNAYSSLCHGGYEMSAALFIIAGEVKTGMKVILEKIRDPVLAFLVARLLTNSDYESEVMKWLFSVIVWDDEIIQILIANLTNDQNLIELFEKSLLETEKVKNISHFGDRRIALFQIYNHLASRRNHGQIILYQVARNLCFDGLAPLAKYMFELAECPYTTARSILPEKVELFDKDQIEDEKVEVDENGDGEILKEVCSFDFGGADLGSVDDWSDSEYGSDEGEVEEEVKVVSVEKIEKKEEVESEVKYKSENKKEFEFDSIVEKSIRKRSFFLSKFFIVCSTENKDELPEKTDNEAGHFALKMGSIEMAASLFDDKMKFQLEIQLAQFIQFCSVRFLFSASIPSEPTDLYSLCKSLLGLTTNQDRNNVTLSYEMMMKNDKDGFSIFSFIGAFVVSLWTYHHSLLYSLLNPCESEDVNSQKSEENNVTKNDDDNEDVLDKIPPPRSLFDIDLSSSRFPDTIPSLLQCYLSENVHGIETSLERDRLLIMYLVYCLMLDRLCSLRESTMKNSEISPTERAVIDDMYTKLSHVLISRKTSITKIIEFYQLALNCPSLSPPNLPVVDASQSAQHLSPIQLFCRSVVCEHCRSHKWLEQIQHRVLSKMPITFVSNWDNCMIKVPETSHVRGAVLAPLDPQTLIVASSNSVFSVNLVTSLVSPEKNLNKSGINDDPLQVIAHPHLNLVLVISPFSTSFYDFNSIVGTKVSISFQQRQGVKFTCGQFSPNGEKVAICSSLVEVYFFDFSIEKQLPFITVYLNGQVNSVVWLNHDTFLIVAYISNKEKLQKLALINLLSSYIMPIPIDPCLTGIINVMEIERRNGFILFGTKSGKAAIVDLVTVCDFRLKWIYDFKKTEVTAVAALNNLFAFGTLDGDVLLANLVNETGNAFGNINMKLFKVQFPVSSIIIDLERIIVAGNANYFEVWKAGEYF